METNKFDLRIDVYQIHHYTCKKNVLKASGKATLGTHKADDFSQMRLLSYKYNYFKGIQKNLCEDLQKK